MYLKVYFEIYFLDLICLLIMACGIMERPLCALVCNKKPAGHVQSIPADLRE